MAVVLFVDMLGARKRWETGGVEASRNAFAHFSRMVNAAARDQPAGSVLRGGIETDSAMLVCETSLAALSIARTLYRWAFRTPTGPTSLRTWLRGSLVPHDVRDFIRRQTALRAPLENVLAHTYSDAAFQAISVEKAGFKGMRLLVHKDVIDANTQSELRITLGERTLIPFRRLRHSGYPKLVDGELQDFLWMADQNEEVWNELSLGMTTRLRHASHDTEEFAQAAATQVVFHECAAIRQTLALRATQMATRAARRAARDAQ
jgi:hypothetical protein